jgi:hypothetical protein
VSIPTKTQPTPDDTIGESLNPADGISEQVQHLLLAHKKIAEKTSAIFG